jgi:hypothetical protein
MAASTCAAAFIETRSGFLFGIGEFTADEEQRSDVWNPWPPSKKRAPAERGAFAGMLGEMEKLWKSIATGHAVAQNGSAHTG